MDVLVAMSGGVDSSVAAARLVDEGHRVVGATLRLWGGESDTGCCSVADVDDARRVCHVLGIDHHVFNYAEEFERDVIEPYVASHAMGRTPNPCIECNRRVKFDLLADRARRLGFGALATGHHARVVTRGGVRRVARGADAAKDQSYVLGHLSARQLEGLSFPVGSLTKDEVRAEARARGLRTWDKPDSQDVCFISSQTGRAAFLAARLDLTAATVVDVDDGVIGEVAAAELVTVGQRRGIARASHGEARFVARVDVAAARVEVGRLRAVTVDALGVEPGSLSGGPFGVATAVWAQWSAHGEARAATLVDGPWRLLLDEPARPVAPGQSVVLYDAHEPDVVVGAAVVAAR
ncbi:MAG: tRNA 2-thiouridine(34) synthase MnmA [Acidimicrobiales bacterium]